MTNLTLWPLTAPIMARPMPVLPDVASKIVFPLVSRPRASPSSIIDKAGLSLTEPPGLNHSALPKIEIWGEIPSRRGIRTMGISGVFPIRSRMLPVPWSVIVGVWCCFRSDLVSTVTVIVNRALLKTQAAHSFSPISTVKLPCCPQSLKSDRSSVEWKGRTTASAHSFNLPASSRRSTHSRNVSPGCRSWR